MAKEEVKGFDSKAMLTKNAEKQTVIRYADRKKVEIIVATRHYKLGQIVSPHKVMAEALIEQGVAKEAKVK